MLISHLGETLLTIQNITLVTPALCCTFHTLCASF